jgi:hypothetical protein
MKLAMQQSQDLARARKCIEAMLGGEGKPSEKESKRNSEKIRPSPVKQSSSGLKAQFSDPPAPPPQAPLPEKPDVAKALADPLIQPLLRRAGSDRPSSVNSSPTRMDHSGDILRLCEELKLAKGELSSQAERMKGLETQLEQERMARESAESRALRLESSDQKEASTEVVKEEEKHDSPQSPTEANTSNPPDLQTQLERLQATMDEMKQQMESYRMRAENAEIERDEARTTLAEMVELKRAENAALAARSASRSRRDSSSKSKSPTRSRSKQNGHAVSPSLSAPRSPTGITLLEKAGLEEGQIITADQARILQQFLDQEVLGLSNTITGGKSGTATVSAQHDDALTYHGRPLTGAALVVVLGVCLMGWMNNWPRVDR